MEVNVNLQGIGLSLVNNILHKEIAYMSITRSQSFSTFVDCQIQDVCDTMLVCFVRTSPFLSCLVTGR